jgi:hypothetical protein
LEARREGSPGSKGGGMKYALLIYGDENGLDR